MKRRTLTIYGVIATAGLVAATLLGVLTSYLSLADKWPGFTVFTVLVNLFAWIVTAYTIYMALHLAPEDAFSFKVGTRKQLIPRLEDHLKGAVPDDCRQIDLMGWSLRSDVFQQHCAFSTWFARVLSSPSKATVRVVLADPESSELLAYRELAERGNKNSAHLSTALHESLETVRGLIENSWKAHEKRKAEVVLASEEYIQYWMIRIDNMMFVSPYLQHGTGGQSPGFIVERDNKWFGVFEEEFERTFRQYGHNIFPSQSELDRLRTPSVSREQRGLEGA